MLLEAVVQLLIFRNRIKVIIYRILNRFGLKNTNDLGDCWNEVATLVREEDESRVSVPKS